MELSAAMELSADEGYERNHVEEAASTFKGARDGGDPVQAAMKTCTECGYINPNISHFTYMQQVNGKWDFACLNDSELLKVLAKEEIKNKVGPIAFKCFKCAGLLMHEDDMFFSNANDEEKPNNQFKKRGLRTYEGRNKSMDDWAARQAISKVARTMGDDQAQKVKSSYEQLKDARVRAGGDWVTSAISRSTPGHWTFSICMAAHAIQCRSRAATGFLSEIPTARNFGSAPSAAIASGAQNARCFSWSRRTRSR